MNVNRVTLGALGTTGVLLAASLTMLAMVSALVTFNGWPRGVGATSVNSVPVERAPAPRLVRAVRHAPGSAARRAAARRTGAQARATGPGSAGRIGARGAGGAPSSPIGPTPRVPRRAPGEGDGGPTRFVHGGRGQSGAPAQSKGPVGQATCTATQAVGGVQPAAGAAMGSACKIAPS
ncbi:MAG: hypothetical protein QOK25_1141 [Thermoleophilaceae bacterium]|nr:hypothetical protein [Thermoleophilaceae bacterium]